MSSCQGEIRNGTGLEFYRRCLVLCGQWLCEFIIKCLVVAWCCYWSAENTVRQGAGHRSRRAGQTGTFHLSLPDLSNHDLLSIMAAVLLHLPNLMQKPLWPALIQDYIGMGILENVVPAYLSRHSMQPPMEGKKIHTYGNEHIGQLHLSPIPQQGNCSVYRLFISDNQLPYLFTTQLITRM